MLLKLLIWRDKIKNILVNNFHEGKAYEKVLNNELQIFAHSGK
jgi:hypothetical protein